jgi:hypothetical protein
MRIFPAVRRWPTEQGEFPWQNLLRDGFEGTSPAGSFPPNGYGLFDRACNLWESTPDWYVARRADEVVKSCWNPIFDAVLAFSEFSTRRCDWSKCAETGADGVCFDHIGFLKMLVRMTMNSKKWAAVSLTHVIKIIFCLSNRPLLTTRTGFICC